MKFYIIPVEEEYQRAFKKRVSRPHSSKVYTIELDFLDFIKKQDLTDNPDEADWHYLPIPWSDWMLRHDYGKLGRKQMQDYLDKVIIDGEKTFTITEYDQEPNFNIHGMTVFSSAWAGSFIPLPLMSTPHEIPEKLPKKKYLASFVGDLKIWPLRMKMRELFKERDDILVKHSRKGQEQFERVMLESYMALSPRGSALGSYRFYEAMQMGVAPLMISDLDFRPFRNFISWNRFSFCVKSLSDLEVLLEKLSKQENLEKSLLIMGKRAKKAWEDYLGNQKWCGWVMKTLELIDTSWEEMKEEVKEDGKLSKHRAIFADIINKYNLKTGVELGTWFGAGAELFLSRTKIEKLYGVDHYIHDFNSKYEPALPQRYLDKVYQVMLEKLEPYGDRYTHIRKYTDDAMDDVPKVDFVFIDADHSYEGVKKDIENWYPKVKKGGIIGGHDYCSRFIGVKEAVDEIFGRKVNLEKYSVWWIQK